MRVASVAGPWLLATCATRAGWIASARVHRNAVFVIERFTWADGAYNAALRPTDLLLQTRVGAGVAYHVKPYVQWAGAVTQPLWATAGVLWGSARLAVRATWDAAAAAASTATTPTDDWRAAVHRH